MRRKDGIEIIVGIPSYNEADTITHVAEVVGQGLEEYFPNRKSIIVNVDNNSPDNTRDAFLDARTCIEKKYISTAKGVRGKGNNFLNLFSFAKIAGAEAVIVVDADLKSITKEWVAYLGEPLYKGYDYVTPLYSRHQFDGSITNHMCYPLFFGILAMDIRQPIGGEFAFSPRLMNYWLKQALTEQIRNYGIDIFMTLHAVLGGFKVCQSGLGAKIHKASAPKLGIMFEQVIETLLSIVVLNKNKWPSRVINDIVEPRIFGLSSVTEPQEIEFDIKDMKDKCLLAWHDNMETLKELLDSYSLCLVQEMFEMDHYTLDILLWTQIFYRLFFKYDVSASFSERKKIIDAMKPLYLARSISFNYETWKYNIKYAEKEVRKQALGFASQKYYLRGLYGCENEKKTKLQSKQVKS